MHCLLKTTRTILWALALISPLLATGAEQAAPRPNILYCLADDWSYPHAGVYGDKVIHTPNFDRVAREGALFSHAFSAAPSCTPSRAAMLTGRPIHQLREGSNLYGFLPKEFAVYPNILERDGYVVGFTGKGWAPGNFQAGDRTRNPAGPNFKSFEGFLKTVPKDKPFCFWFGSHYPHRPYKKGQGLAAGMKLEDVKVPPFWPDTKETRSDILDYYEAAQQFDRQLGECLKLLEEHGFATNTVVVVSGDNGWPFPRGKANLHDAGTRQPLAVRWPGIVKPGTTIDAFVNLYDIAPTFVDIAGIHPFAYMTGQSWVPLLKGQTQPGRNTVFLERERHANARKGDLSYPARAVRNDDYLYIHNLRPDRWPAGDPERYVSVGPFGDCDDGPTKHEIIDTKKQPFFQWDFAKRPADELYDLHKDPNQLTNVADRAEYAAAKKEMREKLDSWLMRTGDPRMSHDDDHLDKYEYFGPVTYK
ncbi:MAG: betC 6 [Verrucomicrobiales bacterium]|nr:betC 6 [Verrucomicrobiales bacterium]